MEYLIYIAMILLIGTLVSVLAVRLQISSVFLLVFVGMFFGTLEWIIFPSEAVVTISLLALILIVFESTAKFKFKDVWIYSPSAIKLVLLFFVSCFFFLTFFTKLLFGVDSWALPFIFSAMVCGSDPATSLSVLGRVKNKAVEILEIESLINTPLIVIVPLTILKYLSEKTFFSRFSLTQQAGLILQQVVIGLIIGMVMGILIVYVMKNFNLKELSCLALLTAAIIVFVSAELLRGSGVLAVTVFGLLFGNLHMKHRLVLEKFASVFTSTIKMLVFVLIGLIVSIPFSIEFFIKTLLLFVLYLGIRFLAIVFSLRGMNFNFKEKVFMSLNTQKGIAVAVVVFSLANLNILGMETILNLTLTFMLYSILLSAVVLRLSYYFIKGETQK